jgi:hypothetical protein
VAGRSGVRTNPTLPADAGDARFGGDWQRKVLGCCAYSALPAWSLPAVVPMARPSRPRNQGSTCQAKSALGPRSSDPAASRLPCACRLGRAASDVLVSETHARNRRRVWRPCRRLVRQRLDLRTDLGPGHRRHCPVRLDHGRSNQPQDLGTSGGNPRDFRHRRQLRLAPVSLPALWPTSGNRNFRKFRFGACKGSGPISSKKSALCTSRAPG